MIMDIDTNAACRLELRSMISPERLGVSVSIFCECSFDDGIVSAALQAVLVVVPAKRFVGTNQE